MAEQIQFELVSPERLLLSRAVDMVVVPGVEGDFGAMPQHAPFISLVRPGVIAVFEGGQVTDRLFVAGGFAEVTPERCTVLAEQALPVGDLRRDRIDEELKDARDDLTDAKDERERAAVEHRIAVGEAMLEAMGTQPY
jgi:F-type H+-transporting ATPase subunit epsilon